MNRLIYQQYKSIYNKIKDSKNNVLVGGTIENRFVPIYEKLNNLNKKIESLDNINYDELQRKLNEINQRFQEKINTVDTVNEQFKKLKNNKNYSVHPKNTIQLYHEMIEKIILESEAETSKINPEVVKKLYDQIVNILTNEPINSLNVFDDEKKKLIEEHQLEIENVKKEFARTSNEDVTKIEDTILQELISIDKKLDSKM